MFVVGCATKKTTTHIKEDVSRDTIIKVKDRVILPAISEKIVIEEPCDTLGNLINFERVFVSGPAKISIKNTNGNLTANVNIDSLVSERINEFKSTYKREKEYIDKEVVKWKTPFWVIICLALSVIINVVLLKLLFFK